MCQDMVLLGLNSHETSVKSVESEVGSDTLVDEASAAEMGLENV